MMPHITFMTMITLSGGSTTSGVRRHMERVCGLLLSPGAESSGVSVRHLICTSLSFFISKIRIITEPKKFDY
jgi:hypothetical protein